MSGLAPMLPLHPSGQDGYALIKDYRTLVQQNLKCLLLTNPGERIMEPEFGVGILRYLFENNGAQLYGSIESKIHEQVSVYMPFVKVTNINFGYPNGDILDPADSNMLTIKLHYEILPLGISDIIEIIDKIA